jgi:hypothetical protein
MTEAWLLPEKQKVLLQLSRNIRKYSSIWVGSIGRLGWNPRRQLRLKKSLIFDNYHRSCPYWQKIFIKGDKSSSFILGFWQLTLL